MIEKKLKNKIRSFLVSETCETKEYNGIPVNLVHNVSISPKSITLLAATEKNRNEIREQCIKIGIDSYRDIKVLDNRDYNYCKNVPEEMYPLELCYWYKCATGKDLNLDNPITFNEKINWMKLYDRDPRKTILADKYLVRDFVKERIGEKYLIPLYGVWEKFDDIDFKNLPDQFVLKCTHGSGMNVIVKDKKLLNMGELKEQFDCWMNTNYAFLSGFELHYKDIKPRIIAEKYLLNDEGTDLPDYKLMIFDGKVEVLWVDLNRFSNHSRQLYNRDWTKLPYTITYPRPSNDTVIEKPDELKELIQLGEKLANDFPHVRVDMYLVKGKIFFGEMTFSSDSGIEKFDPESFNVELGNRIKIATSFNVGGGTASETEFR